MKRNTRDTDESARRISRRALVVGAAQLGIVGTLGYRMQSLQIDQADQFRLLAEENRINIRLIPPARGLFVPVTIADRLTWDDVARVNVNSPALPGITAEVGLSRVYPWGADLGHIVGYVGPVSDYDLSRIDDQDPLLQIPKFQRRSARCCLCADV